MAMLEIHDSRGQVQYVMLQREHPMIFGTDPKCDIVLEAPGILPFHGRIRWKEPKFRIEAFPDAHFLIVNDKKYVQSSFRHGDELRLGGVRVFMVDPDAEAGDLEKTRVQAPPLAPPPAPTPPRPGTPPG